MAMRLRQTSVAPVAQGLDGIIETFGEGRMVSQQSGLRKVHQSPQVLQGVPGRTQAPGGLCDHGVAHG